MARATPDIRTFGAKDAATTLIAGNNLTVQAATNTTTETRFSQEKNSSLMSSGGIGFTYGERKKSDDDRVTATTVVGSDVLAPGLGGPSGSGDVTILGQSVAITGARETSRSTSEQLSSQSGLTVAMTAPVVQTL